MYAAQPFDQATTLFSRVESVTLSNGSRSVTVIRVTRPSRSYSVTVLVVAQPDRNKTVPITAADNLFHRSFIKKPPHSPSFARRNALQPKSWQRSASSTPSRNSRHDRSDRASRIALNPNRRLASVNAP